MEGTGFEPESYVQKLEQLWNGKDREGVLEMVADDVAFSDPTSASRAGKEAYGDWVEGWFSAFADVSLEPVEHIASGNQAAYVIKFAGTHAGELKAPDGSSIPATGKDVAFLFTDFIKLDAAGKIISDKVIFDTADFMRQLGIEVGPEAEARH